jgi:uncharacterized LabA/DUF88 family protein
MALGLGIGLGLGSRGRSASVAPVVYKLIDGAFFVRLLQEYGQHLGADLLGNFNWNALCGNAHRTIFYDALPVRKSGQTQEDFESDEHAKMEFLNSLRLMPNMQVRDGITRLRSKSNRARMSEVLEQKGVDTWIAVDALRYALNGVAEEIHIYTSDSDLYPVFEALQDTRCRGVLFYQDGHTTLELVHCADRSEPLRLTGIIGKTFLTSLLDGDSSGVLLSWQEVKEIASGNLLAKFVKDGNRFGVNLYKDGIFHYSLHSRYPYLVSDWLSSHRVNVPYRKIEACYSQ